MSLQEKEADVRAALERVWRSSRSETFSRLAMLEHFLDQLRSGTVEQNALSNALSAAHRLSGSLGMFGMEKGSSCSAEIEALLCQQTDSNIAVIAELVGRLRTLIEAGPSGTTMPEKGDS